MGERFLAGTARRISSTGACVVETDEGNFFVFGALPGESVVCKPQDDSKHSAELVDVVKTSPERVEPGCAHYGICGGCTLRHIERGARLREKTSLLRGAFNYICGLSELPEIIVHDSTEEGYRNRAQLHREPPDGRPGFMSRGGRGAVVLDDCPVLDPALRRALRAGALRPPREKDRWTVYGRSGKIVCEGGTEEDRFEFKPVGTSCVVAEIIVCAKTFFQSNGEMLEKLSGRLLEEAAGFALNSVTDRAADFYAGVGTFSVFLRDVFARFDLLEENREAVEIARKNLAGTDARIFTLSDGDWVKRHGAKTRYDFICADPGRRGLSPLMRKWLREKPPATLVYISCNAQALARDSRELCAGGLSLRSLDLFDFYPHSADIETFAVFVRKNTA